MLYSLISKLENTVNVLWSKVGPSKMEEIQLKNESVYWPGDVISLAKIDLKKITGTKKTFSTDL